MNLFEKLIQIYLAGDNVVQLVSLASTYARMLLFFPPQLDCDWNP